MRIVSGEYKGRPIEAPQGMSTRPTTDRMRESIASSVASRLGGFEGLRVLDAFAGSGAMGLEALSRGASTCVFLDNDDMALACIKRNISKLGLDASRASAISMDALRGLPKGKAFDLVFLDPPYDISAEDVLGILSSGVGQGTFLEGCLFAYEHSASLDHESLDRCIQDAGFESVGRKRCGKGEVDYLYYEDR